MSPASATASSLPRILLVHGGWADAACWHRVILMLDRAGYDARALQLPLTSHADDIAALGRLLDTIAPPAILVGHGYGGAVIGGIAHPGVLGLIYVAAFAPGPGEILAAPPFSTALPARLATTTDRADFVWAADREALGTAMAQDLPADEQALLFACQKPVHSSIFGAEATVAAWKDRRVRYLVARQDQLLPAEIQRALANRIGAETSHHDCGHMMPLARPDAIVEAIIAMARTSGSS
jgi:pimeloyl-ACP methyl ester carboxylesterase